MAANPSNSASRRNIHDHKKSSYRHSDYHRGCEICARKGNLSKAAGILYKVAPPACTDDTVNQLRLLHPQGPLDYNKEFWPPREQSADFWESKAGVTLKEEAFSIRDMRSYFRNCQALGAPDPCGKRGREHCSPLFLNDDDAAHHRIRKHFILPYITGDFHPAYLHEHARGRLSAFLNADLIRIRPIRTPVRGDTVSSHLRMRQKGSRQVPHGRVPKYHTSSMCR